MGSSNKPVSDQYISLYQQEAVSYYELAESEKFPASKGNNKAISTRIVKWTTSDKDGQFEFFTGPGKYYLIGPSNIEPPKFQLAGQKTFELNLHSNGPEKGPISGRVVLSNDSAKGVAEAVVTGVSTQSVARGFGATTDADGHFQAVRGRAPTVVHAETKDHKLAGIVKIGPDETEVEIPIGPTGSARGRLVDKDTATPLPQRQIEYGVWIEYSDKTFNWRFGGKVTTDPDGRFTMTGLIPGQEYTLEVVQSEADGRPRGWHSAGKVTAPTTEIYEIGDLKLPKPYRQPTIQEHVATLFGDAQSLEDRLKARLRDTRLAYQRVLMVIGDPANPLVTGFFDLEHDRELSKATYNYLFLPVSTVDAKQTKAGQKIAARLGMAWPDANDPMLAVLDENGALVGKTALLDVIADGKFDRDKLAAFLDEHAPDLPDAASKLSDALAKAKREGKRVLVQVSGPRCVWCTVLSRYLDDHHDLVDKEFVYVKLDSRLKNGEAVIKRVRPNQNGGIPWMVILDNDGKPLITSDAADGNIGYPGEPAGRVHFEKMLKASDKHLTDGDIKKLIDALANANK